MRFVDTPSSGARSATTQGYTLVELVVVVSIISVLAAVALPGFGPSEDEKLALAASRVAEAIRFARTESIRTGEPHAIEILFDTQQIIVSKADMTQASPYPAATPTDPTSIRIHPVTKQPFDFNLAQTSGAEVVARPFTYGLGDRRTVLFDAQGTPFFKEADVFYLLDDGLVELELGGQQRNVRVASITGRVTIK